MLEPTTTTHNLPFPPEIRNMIIENLSFSDQASLRLVAQGPKTEVDSIRYGALEVAAKLFSSYELEVHGINIDPDRTEREKVYARSKLDYGTSKYLAQWLALLPRLPKPEKCRDLTSLGLGPSHDFPPLESILEIPSHIPGVTSSPIDRFVEVTEKFKNYQSRRENAQKMVSEERESRPALMMSRAIRESRLSSATSATSRAFSTDMATFRSNVIREIFQADWNP